MIKKYNLLPYKKGQVWLMEGEKYTDQQKDAGITIGDRPVIIYTNILMDRGFIHVIPLSSNPDYKNGVIMNLCKDSKTIALVQDCRPVSVDTLTTYLGAIDDNMMAEIDSAAAVYFGFKVDPCIEQRFFAFAKGRNKIFNAPTNKHNTNDSSHENTEEHSNSTKTDMFGGKRHRRPKAIDVGSLSDDEIVFFCTAKITDIIEKYHISKATVTRYRNELKEKAKSIIDSKNTNPTTEVKNNKKPSAPRIVSTYRYKNKTYKKFANKKIEKFTLDEKRLFTQLDSCKLSTTMNVPLDVICITQQSFKEELGL